MTERKVLYQNEFIREETDNEYKYIFVNDKFVWKNKIGTLKYYCNDFDNHESGIAKPAFIGEFRMFDCYGSMHSFGYVLDEFNWEKYDIDTDDSFLENKGTNTSDNGILEYPYHNNNKKYKIAGYSYQKDREVYHKDSIYEITTKYLLDKEDNIIEENLFYIYKKIDKKTDKILEKYQHNYTYIMNPITKRPINVIDNINYEIIFEYDKLDEIFFEAYCNSEFLFLEKAIV
jgi:hypothetical protein